MSKLPDILVPASQIQKELRPDTLEAARAFAGGTLVAEVTDDAGVMKFLIHRTVQSDEVVRTILSASDEEFKEQFPG